MYVVSLFSHCIPDQAEVLLNLKHKSGGTCVRVHSYMYYNKYYGDDV